ncbi:MAG: hypothetical protein MR717_03280, partial [Prevotella sp.]|nr:hypothetical protein [Prevotella sp.]
MNLIRTISILYLLLFFTGESELYAWTYPTSKPSYPFTSGDGSYSNPYEIRNADDLANLAYMVREEGEDYSGKHFVMTNDITLNENLVNADCTDRNTGDNFKVWTPIGNGSGKKFKGDFNGNSHTISGLFIEANDYYNGLFGVVDEGTIRNLTIADSYMCASYPFGSNFYGFIAGQTSNATLLNCHVKNSCVKNIDNDSRKKLVIGGLVGGSLEEDVFSKCSFNGNFVLRSFYKEPLVYAGGILGYGNTNRNYSSKVKLYSCSTKGKFMVTGSPAIGVYGIGVHIGEAYGCVAGMDFDIQTHGEYYTGEYRNPLDVASFSYSAGPCTLCTTYGTIKVGEPDNPVRVQPLGARRSEFFNIRIGTFSSVGRLYENDEDKKDQCAAYTNVELYLHDDSKGNAFITSFGLAYITSKNSYQILKLQNCIVAGNHHIESKTAIRYNPVLLFDYDDANSSKDFDEAWEMAKGAKYCTYVNKNKDEGFYFSEYEDKKFESITPEELKGDQLLAALNALNNGGNQWGRITTEGDPKKDYPMPVICGGSPFYNGDGSEGNPYVINTESELNKLKEAVNNVTDFSGKYIQLGSDIYITGTLDESIGNVSEKPFKGHFDGNGHAIIGLRKSLFGYMYGKVKNLALVDCNIWETNYATALARQVGDESNKAEVSNCYVSGIIASSKTWDSQGYASVFGFQVINGSSIHDCYFKGRFVIKATTATMHDKYNVAGIAFYNGNSSVTTSGTTPQGIYNCYASFDVKVESNSTWFPSCDNYGICYNDANENGLSDCYFVSSASIASYNSNMKLSSESELNGKFNGKTGWLQGVYRPLLVSAKHYKAKSPEGADAYFDAIPEANPKKNYFYNISIDDPYSDVSLWQLPNMAVYVPNEKKDYITNGYLDQSAD